MNEAYDFETGLKLEEIEASEYEKQLDQNYKEVQSVVNMTGHPGWKIVAQFVEEMIEANKDKLVETTDMEEVKRLQEHVKAYCNVMAFVENKNAEAAQIHAEIQSFKQSDQGESLDNQEETA